MEEDLVILAFHLVVAALQACLQAAAAAALLAFHQAVAVLPVAHDERVAVLVQEDLQTCPDC